MGENDWMYKMGSGKLKFIKKDIEKNIRRFEKSITRLTNQINDIEALLKERNGRNDKKKRNAKNPKFHAY